MEELLEKDVNLRLFLSSSSSSKSSGLEKRHFDGWQHCIKTTKILPFGTKCWIVAHFREFFFIHHFDTVNQCRSPIPEILPQALNFFNWPHHVLISNISIIWRKIPVLIYVTLRDRSALLPTTAQSFEGTKFIWRTLLEHCVKVAKVRLQIHFLGFFLGFFVWD